MPKWSEEETDWLIENRTKGINYCSNHLQRSYTAVSQKLFTLRLPSTHKDVKETVKSHRREVTGITMCRLPVFHSVMIGIYPVSLHLNHHGSSNLWRKRRSIILKIHDYMCVYCGNEADTVDHVVPISKGGMDNLENLVAACQLCNYGMGNKTKHIVWIK